MESGYKKLALALAINTVLMFFIPYAMIEELSHLHAKRQPRLHGHPDGGPMGIVMLLVTAPCTGTRSSTASSSACSPRRSSSPSPTDPEIERLCEEIVRAQKDETAQIEGMLERY